MSLRRELSERACELDSTEWKLPGIEIGA